MRAPCRLAVVPLALLTLAACGPQCRIDEATVREPCLPDPAAPETGLVLTWTTPECGGCGTSLRCDARVVGEVVDVRVEEELCTGCPPSGTCPPLVERSCTLPGLPPGNYEVFVNGGNSFRITVAAGGATQCG